MDWVHIGFSFSNGVGLVQKSNSHELWCSISFNCQTQSNSVQRLSLIEFDLWESDWLYWDRTLKTVSITKSGVISNLATNPSSGITEAVVMMSPDTTHQHKFKPDCFHGINCAQDDKWHTCRGELSNFGQHETSYRWQTTSRRQYGSHLTLFWMLFWSSDLTSSSSDIKQAKLSTKLSYKISLKIYISLHKLDAWTLPTQNNCEVLLSTPPSNLGTKIKTVRNKINVILSSVSL